MTNVHLVTRAPLRATRKQVRHLCSLVPELGRVDIDLLELALDMIPICVLAWRTIDEAEAIARELGDLDLHVLDSHALQRLQLDCPTWSDSLIEVSFVPAFHPGAWIAAIVPRSGTGLDLHVRTARETPDSFPIAMRIAHGLDLDHLREIDVLHGGGWLDARGSQPLFDALAALRERPDPAPPDEQGRDGMDVELRMSELVIERWSPDPNDAPRIHATLLALLDACARIPLVPELHRYVAHLRRYL